MGRVIQTTFPSTLTETYTYDQLYNLTSKSDRKNQTIQYVYDSLYRMTNKTYPDQTSANYVYDLVGKVQQVTDPTGTYGFAYDNMGRLIGTSTQYAFLPGHNFQNSYSYDAASNRIGMTAPDGSTNTYGYDTLNRLSSLTNSLTGQLNFSYDALSRRIQLARPNGVNTNYTYDSVSHLLSVLHQAGSTTLDGASYTYDYAGNRTSKTNYLNGVTSNYGYDAIYELLQVTQGGSTTESYSYDAVGNRLSSLDVPSYDYNSSNELTSSSNGSYTYDANGNTLTDPSGKQYTWDFENRLVQAVVPGTNGGTTTFKYDPFGRRIQKSGPLGATNYLYDGPRDIEEFDSGGNALARYTQARRIDEPLAELRQGTTSFYEQDGLGSVTSLSNSSGAAANAYTYDSFGKLISLTGTISNPFQYAGREFDQETGIYYNRARYLDQNAGRFVNEDPARFRISPDFYSYVGNRPTIKVDPTGFGSCTWNFVVNYWNGAPVNLADWGLGSAFENSQSVESAVSAFEASIVAQGSSLAAALCAGKKQGRQIAVFTSDGQTITNVTSVPCLFSVGHSTFFERATSTLDADCCSHKFTISSFEHYFIRDKFTDPLDGEKMGMPFDLPFSQPYAINYDFYRIKSYDGTF